MARHPGWPVLIALTTACAGGGLATTLNTTAPTPAPDAFECVRNEIKRLGWTQTSYDTDELRVTARKFDEEASRPDVQFRRLVHRVSIDIDPEVNGTGAVLTARAATFAERSTHRGPTEEQEKTSDEAVAAAQAILQRCNS